MVRYAEATRVEVRARLAGDSLEVEVRDNGRGGADPEQGTGLRGLTDRVMALGGSLRLNSVAGDGTTVRVEIPCAS